MRFDAMPIGGCALLYSYVTCPGVEVVCICVMDDLSALTLKDYLGARVNHE